MAYTNLSIGSGGEEVRKLQNALMSAGYDVGSSGADGRFGSATQAAVKKYQQDRGLSADGIAGEKTQTALYGSSGSAAGGSMAAPAASGGGQTAGGAPLYSAPSSAYDAANDQAYQEALRALLEAQKNAPTYANSYESQLKDLYDQITKRGKFQYDINEDALYQQYAQQYAQKGRMAMMDTMGQAAALTGGYGSTYGQAVGQQQYDAYLQQLNDVVPELYQMAYAQYQDEGDRMQQQYAMLGDLADDEYDKYRDAYNQWLTERDYAQGNADTAYDRGYDQWLQQWSQFNTDRNYQLEKENADRQYQLQLEQFRWQQEQAAAKARSGGSSGSSGGNKSNKSSKSSTARTRSGSNLVSVSGYGEISYDDAEMLEREGYIKLRGVDRNGNPVYDRTAKKNNSSLKSERCRSAGRYLAV